MLRISTRETETSNQNSMLSTLMSYTGSILKWPVTLIVSAVGAVVQYFTQPSENTAKLQTPLLITSTPVNPGTDEVDLEAGDATNNFRPSFNPEHHLTKSSLQAKINKYKNLQSQRGNLEKMLKALANSDDDESKEELTKTIHNINMKLGSLKSELQEGRNVLKKSTKSVRSESKYTPKKPSSLMKLFKEQKEAKEGTLKLSAKAGGSSSDSSVDAELRELEASLKHWSPSDELKKLHQNFKNTINLPKLEGRGFDQNFGGGGAAFAAEDLEKELQELGASGYSSDSDLDMV